MFILEKKIIRKYTIVIFKGRNFFYLEIGWVYGIFVFINYLLVKFEGV